MASKIKSSLHHWWPRALSTFWADSTGQTYRLSSDGALLRAPPENFGAITNAHTIKFGDGTVWDTTFEPNFARVDSELSDLVEQLLLLETSSETSTEIFSSRFLAQPVSDDLREQLARCVASLIARSPRLRNAAKISTEYYRKQFGFENYEADNNLIAANLRGCFDAFTKTIFGGGKFAILFADVREFIFGDGFLHNFPPAADMHHDAKCIVPLTPTITIAFSRPSRYRNKSKLVTLRLLPEEVDFFNEIVQIYSKDFIFYRSDRPRTVDAFARREFLEFPYHETDWLRTFFATIASFPAPPKADDDLRSFLVNL